MNGARHIRGFTLMEILVAILILSVGLLGLAGMQVAGLRSVTDASTYTQATLAVNNIIERIRTNTQALYLITDSSDTAQINCANMPNPYCSAYYNGSSQVAAQSCTAAQLAAFDLNIWFCGGNIGNGNRDKNGVKSMFTQASFTINNGGVACSARAPCTVSLLWREINPDHSDINGDNIPDDTIQRNITLTMVP